MHKSKINPRVFLLMALATIAGCATKPVEPVTNADAATVASVFFAEKARNGLARAYWRTERAEWAVNCVSSWDVDEMGQALAPALQRELTVDELRQARDFLATPTGQRYAERVTYRVPGAPATPHEAVDLRVFSETNAGRKLMNPATALRMGNALASVSGDKLEACRERHASAPTPKTLSDIGPPILERKLNELACTEPHPTYPREAIRGDQSGSVNVRLWINPRGLVYMTLIVKSSNVPSLDAAAERAIQGMQCRPYIDNGKAITVTAVQPISFHLR